MDDFSTPGLVNGFGVPASPSNYIVPGKRPMSSMTPTIVVDKHGDVQLVIGGAGGTRIPTVVAYVILRHFYLNENIEDALLARRLHHQLAPNRIEYEPGFDQSILDGLLERGHVLNSISSLATLTAIAREDDGSLTAVFDTRRDGSAIVFQT
jgi:gamma-glutamyltranspeptidase / glutathione hydrolase / leukotriene-C4 hydrolase